MAEIEPVRAHLNRPSNKTVLRGKSNVAGERSLQPCLRSTYTFRKTNKAANRCINNRIMLKEFILPMLNYQCMTRVYSHVD